jgi:hypothetical protein
MPNNEISEMLKELFWQMKMQLGDVVQSTFVHASEKCPGCGGQIKGIKYKGKDVMSLNTFIYRDHKVLIGYFLCGKCAKYVLKASETPNAAKTPVHDKIEDTLKREYLKKTGH